jgi:hypothetical protein
MKFYSLLFLLLVVVVDSFGQHESKADSISKLPVSKKVLIRFGSPINENNMPLYVVDGVPLTAEQIKDIDPETIESMTVLKGNQAAVLHGNANGAIIIKTKTLPGLPMDGTYKIEYANMALKDGTITFDGTAFTMRNAIFPTQSGMITYGKNIISLISEFDPDIVINFRASDMGRDTINFQVDNKKIAPVSYLHVAVNRGRLIKVK